jgi:hypothetical protein
LALSPPATTAVAYPAPAAAPGTPPGINLPQPLQGSAG